MIRVLIAAPTPMLRAGLRALLETAEIRVAGELPALAPAGVDLAGVDVIVADVALLPGAARAVAGDRRLAIVVLAEDEGPAAELRALPLIGWGIVSPEATAAELHAAVLAASQGMIVVPLPLVDRLLGQRAAEALAAPPGEPLTAREREVLELVSQGLSNKLIARRLQISEHTVKFHVSSIYTKLGASSRTDAVSRGARYGLITL